MDIYATSKRENITSFSWLLVIGVFAVNMFDYIFLSRLSPDIGFLGTIVLFVTGGVLFLLMIPFSLLQKNTKHTAVVILESIVLLFGGGILCYLLFQPVILL